MQNVQKDIKSDADFDMLRRDINRLYSLISIAVSGFFGRSAESAREYAPLIMELDYERYQDMMIISLGMLQDIRKTLRIMQKNET
ncbi:MAG: hypothetical protein FWF44_05380 [Defluviitaleaceae bacterium]|nr:hypothetical protein [Defluviitaleaceae bacterium]